jgi:hypothetical protein
VVALAFVALAFRATLYWRLPPVAGAPYGRGDVIDFGLGLVLFAVSCLCAGAAVALSMHGAAGADQRMAFRPAVVGITTFVFYYFVHPHVPRLM